MKIPIRLWKSRVMPGRKVVLLIRGTSHLKESRAEEGNPHPEESRAEDSIPIVAAPTVTADPVGTLLPNNIQRCSNILDLRIDPRPDRIDVNIDLCLYRGHHKYIQQI